jgi:hypothetical protein
MVARSSICRRKINLRVSSSSIVANGDDEGERSGARMRRLLRADDVRRVEVERKRDEVRWTLQERCVGAEESEGMFVQLNANR